MGSLILCHNKQAKHPYEISRIHCKIYSIEELCFYLCNNLYLIDYTIMNEQLCIWLDEELALHDLAKQLMNVLQMKGTIEKFVLTILSSSKMYGDTEMIRIQNVLERLKNQKDIERQKFKGDNLLESGEIEEAILVYQSILAAEQDESVDKGFYGRIYANLGAAYGKMFLYQEAAKMYDRAYDILKDPELRKSYLYASNRYMSLEEYHILLTKDEELATLNMEMHQECKEIEKNTHVEHTQAIIDQWKDEYRRSHI